ncbi:hypothetical protein SETIT_3G120300v2 [Setaria italica]|uniref:non-specific serine/threonine protein kinase n=2 Tax=Setaria italica TaxID=4555 RepID=A0A368QEA8_SETIT|nr:G-type lectin S-receptor-like serine/threonine-protein kinase LECRK3 [Setaria italica]RCV16213.1 hypothetical protein SETIT_3G120300v2 [Setaria italica]
MPPCILCLSLILFANRAIPAKAAQANETEIPLGSKIDAGGVQSWVSPSGRFAFGFYPVDEGFSIGVWLIIGESRNIVWTANRDDPPVSGGSIQLTYGGLQWIPANAGSQGKFIFATSTQPASAAMMDTGNFVLYDINKQVLLSTFASPTDTLLPGQNLLPGSQLFSSVSDTSHATGKYRLSNQLDGNLVMYPVDAIDPDSSYWNTGTFGNSYLLTVFLDPNGTLWMFDQKASYTKVLFLTNQSSKASTDTNVYFRLTLDADGILRLYSHVFFRQGRAPMTEIVWLQPSSDRCDVKGVCGPNSFCHVSSKGQSSCSCLPGFEFSSANQSMKGCWRVRSGGCTGNSSNDDIRPIPTMVELKNTSWSDLSYAVPPQTTSIEACKDLCLSDCACEVARFDSYCSKQMLPMRYGKMVPGSNTTLFVKVYTYESKGSLRRTRSGPVSILISGAALTVFSLLVLLASMLLCKHRLPSRYMRAPRQQDSEFDDESIAIRSYSFQDLELSTDGFAQELGRGAYGTVFKGVLTNVNMDIAVKRLERMAENGEREFQREVRAIARTHHRNLVRLLGFCNEGMHRLLVYEYLSNGSLADLLFRSDAVPSWSNRVAILLDVARGLQYLHEEIDCPIIHCDIKPENILIDSNGVAKIADFGLAKLLIGNQTQTFTGVRGTRGYLAPEWSKNTAITVKVDVYSYGVMLLEAISCKKSMELKLAGEECNISEWAYEYVISGNLKQVAAGECINEVELERMVRVGIWCTQNQPVTRPTMKSAVQMMEGSAEVRRPPPPASFSQSLVRSASS